MASKAHAKKSEFDTDNDDVEFDNAPDELDHDNDGPSIALGFDDLEGLTTDDEREEEERAKMYPPPGDWEKAEPFKMVEPIPIYEEDSQPGDLLEGKGRLMLMFNGQPEPRTNKGIEFKPTLFIRMSPDLRRSQNKPNEADLAYKLWLQAKEIYEYLHDGETTNDVRKIAAMMIEDNYVIRTLNGDSGPFVLNIKPKKERQRRG